MRRITDALIVLGFMALVTIHLQTDILGRLTNARPRAVRGLDWFLDTAFVSWLGHGPTVALFALLTLALPPLVYFKGAAAKAKQAHQPAFSGAAAERLAAISGRPAAAFGKRGTND